MATVGVVKNKILNLQSFKFVPRADLKAYYFPRNKTMTAEAYNVLLTRLKLLGATLSKPTVDSSGTTDIILSTPLYISKNFKLGRNTTSISFASLDLDPDNNVIVHPMIPSINEQEQEFYFGDPFKNVEEFKEQYRISTPLPSFIDKQFIPEFTGLLDVISKWVDGRSFAGKRRKTRRSKKHNKTHRSNYR